jgi:hypothetical protein
MLRRWIYLKNIEPFDEMHILQPDGSFIVDEKKDGKTTQEHRKGIDSIMEIIKNGQKVMPILVMDNENGTYERLDGFKRYMAHNELGKEIIECFICDRVECATQQRIPFLNGEMWCGKGGQPKEVYSLFEGGENPKPEDIKFLYNSQETRIEARENPAVRMKVRLFISVLCHLIPREEFYHKDTKKERIINIK